MIVFLIFVGDKQDWSSQMLQDVARLLTVDKAAVSVESAGVPVGLQRMSSAVSSVEGWKENFATADPSAALDWLDENIGPEKQDFLNKFGHRCLKEFELLSHPWEEDMSPVVQTLQAMLKGEESRALHPSGVENNPEKQVSTGSMVKDFLLSCLIPLAHQSVGRREESKSLLIRAVHQMRQAYRALAQSLVQQNLLPNRDLIGFLSHYELRQLVLDKRNDLVPKTVRRQKLLGQLEHLQFPEIVIGCQLEQAEEEVRPALPDDTVGLVVGTPACPGRVTGPARVITRLDEAATIEPGDILITTSTDIGWSPYFPMLGGVVTELGGLISHGAVVAREYGLPCLVGARGATTMFTTGDLVMIDTELGIIYKTFNS
jgi:pyruvate,water dikinase